MAAKLQAAEVVVVLDSDSGEDAGGGDSRGDDGDTKSGRQLVDEMEVAPFVRIVYNMLEGKDETKTKSVMLWSSTGASFIVTDPILFADQLLPIYFRHKNLNSFCRQLTDHGFKKMKSKQWEYAHEYFQKGQKHLMKYIKNKRRYARTAKRTTNKPATSSEELRRMMVEVKDLKKKIQDLEEKLVSLYRKRKFDAAE